MGISKHSNYHSYLLRLWRVEDYIGHEWRVSLENVENGEKYGFACLEELIDYLWQITITKEEPTSEGSQRGVQG
jgi:hypothetical protein